MSGINMQIEFLNVFYSSNWSSSFFLYGNVDKSDFHNYVCIAHTKWILINVPIISKMTFLNVWSTSWVNEGRKEGKEEKKSTFLSLIHGDGDDDVDQNGN